MFYLVSYDVNGQHGEVLAECLKKDFFDIYKDTSGKDCRLPNTTLIGKYPSISSVEREFRAAVAAVKTKTRIEKLAIVPFSTMSSGHFSSDKCVATPKK